jgi:hypothetical protein
MSGDYEGLGVFVWIMLIGLAGVSLINIVAYLAACFEAGRWLSWKEWINR